MNQRHSTSEIKATEQPTHESCLCVACKNSIPTDASLCPVCKSHQANWKNQLQYFAGLAVLIVLIFSGSSWLYLEARKAIKAIWYYDEVRVISCNTLRSAVVLNRGDGDVFLSHMLLYMPGRSSAWAAKRLDFEEVLPKDKFMRREFPPAKISDNAEWIRNLDPVKFQNLIEIASNGNSCFEFVFFELSDSFLSELRQMAGAGLNTFEVAGYLEYRGQKSDAATRVSITGVGVLRRDIRAICKRSQ